MKRGNFYLSDIDSKDDLKELFIENWNWQNPSFSQLLFNYPEEIKNNIQEAEILAERLEFKIIFFNLKGIPNPDRKLKVYERKILTLSEIRNILDNSLFIFSCDNFNYLDFVKAEKIGGNVRLKRFAITPENRDKLRTPCEQLEKLKLETSKINFSYIRNKIEEAFSVEAVSEKFYREYIEIFEKIRRSLNRQQVNILGEEKQEKLRDYIHQILNRIMFLYFVQKRGCFGGDKNFLANFWDAYKNNYMGNNEFHKKWLEVLFFESLCQPSRFYQKKSYLGYFNNILKNAPYLKGGLFEKNELDEIGWVISDNLFDDIFEFFESYNFTIEESTPFDIEIAINPEMLGNIYEYLVSVEEIEEQRRAGIFYTPKVEIELMIRRSLVEFLFNKTNIEKEKLYKFIFPSEEREVLTQEEAKKILKELEEIFILDPACGSGHYLVVATQILYELKEILWQKLNISHLSKYEEKKKIIERNIYGNDIKKWATEIAKLRLWLELFVDAPQEILENQQDPILPNLNFKIRYGDSLVQRIGKELVPIRKLRRVIASLTNDLKYLIQKKEQVYKTGNPKEYRETLILEKKLLLNAIEYNQLEIKKRIQEINIQLKTIQKGLFEKDKEEASSLKKKLEKERENLLYLSLDIEKFYNELKTLKEPPMIWDLAFAEVFQMKNGFDIVIANPPYVRRKKIKDLLGFYSSQEYVDKLIEQVNRDWQYNLKGELIKSPIPQRFDKDSDLYIYFYLKGLKLLNPNGVFCYISSNSWLDVEFGRILQEVLLKRVPIIAIYDNMVKRSFKQADVNTIIALMKAPEEEDFEEEIKQNEVRFVNFKKPFEEIMDSRIFIELEKNDNLKQFSEGKRRENEIYRLHIINQKELYQLGLDLITGEYIGNKWGGKYLRAPEIYFKILEKGRGIWIRLGDIIKVHSGITTGADKFFYVTPIEGSTEEILKKKLNDLVKVKNGNGWVGEIEVDFLKPIIKSPRELKTTVVKLKDLNYLVFMCNKSKEELKGTKALEYIKWGEKQEYHKKSICKNRKRWWSLKGEIPLFTQGRVIYERFITCVNKIAFVDAGLIVPVPKINCINVMNIVIFLNSTIGNLFLELGGRVNFGEGALEIKNYEYENIFIIDPQKINFNCNLEDKIVNSIFTELGFDPTKPIREQEPNPLPDRKALDDVVFDALGLTEEERKEVYWAVAELVKQRLEKARSV